MVVDTEYWLLAYSEIAETKKHQTKFGGGIPMIIQFQPPVMRGAPGFQRISGTSNIKKGSLASHSNREVLFFR